jgi:hypothetical protein
MNKPDLIVKDILLIPVLATKRRITEIGKELKNGQSQIVVNSLFLTLVSYIESMQKEIITYYLKYHPEKIGISKKIDIRVETIASGESFEVIEKIISEYIDSIPTWDRLKMLIDVLGIQKPPKQIESEIKNISDIRNELIHKNLEVKRKYGAASNRVNIELEYFYDSIKSYEKFINHIHESISHKYSEYTKINALKNLWHFMFNTPLCANFEDYWYIDNERDIITGFKRPDIANGLSHSEMFMLELWRSQVQGGYKVSFLNLSSLTPDTQSRVFMFLKLSNDLFLYNPVKSKA